MASSPGPGLPRSIGKVGIKGIFSGGTEFTPQWNRFAHEELLDGAYMTPTYGNTLMGLAANLIAKLIDRHRWIAYFGLAVIVFVAFKMIYEGWVDPQLGIITLF